jgi:hypothetical protein
MENTKYYGAIYKITNIQNNKSYIGQTTQNVYNYINSHFEAAEKNIDNNKKHFYCAIRKYGLKNFKKEILGYCSSKEELNEAEIEAIWIFRTFGSDGIKRDGIYGYNMTIGGEGIKGIKHKTWEQIFDDWVQLYGESEAQIKYDTWRENNRLGRIGKGSSLKGKKWEELFPDEEIRIKKKKDCSENMSKLRKGKSPWNKGLTIEDERVKNYSEKSGESQKGRISWNKGLTKETDNRVAQYGKLSSETKKDKEIIPWNKGLTKETDERVKKYGENGSKTKLKKRKEYSNGDFDYEDIQKV